MQVYCHRTQPQTSTPVIKSLGQPSPSVVDSPAIIADSLLSTSELWSESPIRDLGGVDGESNKSAMRCALFQVRNRFLRPEFLRLPPWPPLPLAAANFF